MLKHYQKESGGRRWGVLEGGGKRLKDGKSEPLIENQQNRKTVVQI